MWTKQDCLDAAARGEGCLGRAGDDEPVFVLRGRDVAFIATVRHWAQTVETLNNGNNRKTIEARALADEVLAWQARNGCRVPD